MNRIYLLFFLVIILVPNKSISQDNLKLWYIEPAANWNEALPIGNGQLAAMVFGDQSLEKVQLNEETVWSGEPGNNILPEIRKYLPEIRKHIFDGKYKDAQDLANEYLPRQAGTSTNYGMSYQPFGNLEINFPNQKEMKDYNRELDVSNTFSLVKYQTNGINYRQEMIASLTDDVILMELSADKPGSVTCIETNSGCSCKKSLCI